jgi:alpha-galactosidase
MTWGPCPETHQQLLAKGSNAVPSKKIVCLGAGSHYFSRALVDIAVMEGLSGSEVTLYDIDFEKAQLMAKLGKRFAREAGTRVKMRACQSLVEAVDGADFAVSSIGGSGPSLGGVYATAAHSADVMIPAKYGIYQIVGDTGGPAGMMMGLRSIPVYLSICTEMERRCPEVVVLNHSNPMAVLCRAMLKYSGIRKVIGICHGVQGGIMQLASLLGVQPEELEVVWIGTNHYYWFTRIRLHGRDVYPQAMAKARALRHPHGEQMSARLSEIYGHRLVYQEDGHALEFYPFLAQTQDPTNLPYGYGERVGPRYQDLSIEAPGLSKAEQAKLRAEGLKEFAKRLSQRGLPEPEMSFIRGEGIASLIEAIATGKRQVRILNLPNQGVVPNLPDHAVLEVEGVTDSQGARGIYAGEAPLSLMGLLQKRIAWQELVVEAGVKGDCGLALQALLMDEMAILPEQSAQMLNELLAASKDLLPQFK